MTTTEPCIDCAGEPTTAARPTKYCPADGAWRCRPHRTLHLARLGVGKAVPQPPASVGRQASLFGGAS